MRGKVLFNVLICLVTGITPAYAGKRSIGPDCHQLSEDHPRLCGEKSVRKPHSVPEQGSPPPMRGKVRTYSRKFHYTRITPAYAGKSRALYAEAKNYKDHPRLCGEKLSSRVLQLFRQGSPPPMRGKGAGDATIFQCCRITPAYAGKSRSAVETNRRCRDHPRLCGEKSPLWYNNRRGEGSPPPMRGKDPAYV